MIAELIFSGICGAIASFVIFKYLAYRQKKKREDPNRILDTFKKQKKDFYVDGKKIDIEDQLRKALMSKDESPPSPPEEKTYDNLPDPPMITEPVIKPLKDKPKSNLNKMLGKR